MKKLLFAGFVLSSFVLIYPEIKSKKIVLKKVAVQVPQGKLVAKCKAQDAHTSPPARCISAQKKSDGKPHIGRCKMHGRQPICKLREIAKSKKK